MGGYKYSTIKFDGDDLQDYFDKNNNRIEEIKDLSQINIFVGANNSGKSRLIRGIMKIKNINFKLNDLDKTFLIDKLKKTREDIEKIFKSEIHKDIGEFKINGKNWTRKGLLHNFEHFINDFYYFKENEAEGKLMGNLKPTAIELRGFLEEIMNSKYENHQQESFEIALKNSIFKLEYFLQEFDKYHFDFIKFEKYYTPILRGLHCFNDWLKDLSELSSKTRNGKRNSGDFYGDRMHDVYFRKNKNGSFPAFFEGEIFTGQKLYDEIQDKILGEEKEEQEIREFEQFLKRHIFNQTIRLIPRRNKNKKNISDNVLYIKIGNKEARPIYDLGDGIQALIISTFPLFTCKNGLFFIEEPETHLHPGMQRKFIEILQKIDKEYNKNHQYFITTHSNHLLDLTLDHNGISIYNLKEKDGEKKILEQVDVSNDKAKGTLQLLGVQNSSVFLSNKTIWVEGITDRWYIREFLRLYQKKKKKEDKNFKRIEEDIDYSFVEYGGNNITHWSFLDEENLPININRLCGNAILVVDGDNIDDNEEDEGEIEKSEESNATENIEESKDNKRSLKETRMKKLKKHLKERFIKLDCREIENCLTIEIIENIIESYPSHKKINKKAFIPENLKSGYPHKSEYLGKFIEDKIISINENKELTKRTFSGDSGTIKDKREFCELACGIMNKEDFGIDKLDNNGENIALTLAEKVYNFIVDSKN